MLSGRRRYVFVAAILAAICLLQWHSVRFASDAFLPAHIPLPSDDDFIWRTIEHHYPVTSFRPLPTSTSKSQLPSVQAIGKPETAEQRRLRVARQQAIKDAFVRCWSAYKERAWLHDEVTPISGRPRDTFGGWGATLVDSLDTLWLMGLRDEFENAVAAVEESISFSATDQSEINIFETTIRFLGGLLSAYDLSQDRRLLIKARDVGDMIYKAFDTPNHLPVTRWNIQAAADGERQAASSGALLAEIGSLTMELTRLSLITGDPKYYDAVQHISELLAASQKETKLPGMWPVVIDAANEKFDAGSDYAIGGMADSTYEYLPKMMAILGEKQGLYQEMYERSMDVIHQHVLYRPMTPSDEDVLLAGSVHAEMHGNVPAYTLKSAGGHLDCFAGGMYALGGKLTSSQQHVDIGTRLTMGCVWAYNLTTTGVMAEYQHFTACPDRKGCTWDEAAWHRGIAEHHDEADPAAIAEAQRIPPGITKISDARYILRPEAVESVFVMYRVTGEEKWRDMGWHMWEAIDALTRTELANSAVNNVNHGPDEDAGMSDTMESFWLGETLKYLYLLFSEPSLVSLDEWVFNTEAHPFKRL
ncbi:glycosyl hydrolase family 47 protein [Stachybotrys elegans]|uniref:alpha-1,2-Mannosidase n=1 Tax=Stachybotrys elegans TaxID=80388 RepID=A0A8K0SBU8_9HYPO|nr:glycosyl hydrolase family 47 protein [Stachybotrys elegans]